MSVPRFLRTRRVRAAAALVAGLLVPLTLTGTGSAASYLPGADTVKVPASVRNVSSGWNIPWGLSWLPDGSALINERDSFQIFKLTRSGVKTKVGTVPYVVNAEPESGLRSITVSPNWTRDHYIYIYHAAAEGNRIARMVYDGSKLSGYETLVTGIKSHGRNGGRIKFGPDGYLYATTGDAGTPQDAQDKDSLNGKILRMTADGRPAPGNPFGTLVYSYGHRNPQGITWDPQGRLWETEIGQDAYDEVNLIQPGRNYGWPTCEGACSVAGMTNPKQQWRPVEAVPSGLTYSDGALYIAALRGRRLWRIPVSGTTTGTPVAYYVKTHGRMRLVEKVPGSELLPGLSTLLPGQSKLWITTDAAGKDKDKVFEVDLK
ncbi:PQQ-dependent sugar dehydrogenase [Streptomyces sp. NPDC051219]|uniref:PQQ-dependent sugar dehydrogenase n=1 Tax=Streptomyces sp. NPDC051219 TaxID=3155283 RepID=UPI003443D8B4